MQQNAYMYGQNPGQFPDQDQGRYQLRQKSKKGPIGVEYSELINLETETEFKHRHKHIFKLNNGNVDPNAAEDIAEGYINENGVYHGVDQDEKLFKENEKLLQRLTAATNKDAANRQQATLNSDVNDVGGYQGDQDRTNHTDIVNVTNGGISTQNP